MDYRNGVVYGPDFQFHRMDFRVEDGLFAQVGGDLADGEDLDGGLVLPGLVDIHIHGSAGAMFSEIKPGGLCKMAGYLAQNGVTSFAPTTISDTEDTLYAACGIAADMHSKHPEGCARVCAVNMEGPFFSYNKRGALDPKNRRDPEIDLVRRLNQAAEGLVRLVNVAPELPGALAFIREISKDMRVSLGHTEADYSCAKAGFDAGASHVTHLFNAMPPFLHRQPGLVGAAAENRGVSAELICDGIHIHESVVRSAFKLFGARRIVLISDSIALCGLPDGQYGDLYLSKRKITLPSGTIYGAATNLFEGMRNAVSFGIPREDAIRCATWNGANSIGALSRIGSIEPGKEADFLVCTEELQLKQVFLGGISLL